MLRLCLRLGLSCRSREAEQLQVLATSPGSYFEASPRIGTFCQSAHLSTGMTLANGLAGHLRDASLAKSEAFVDGEWTAAKTTFEVINPATGAPIADVADCGSSETEAAIDAAHRAFEPWARRPASHRAAILHRWAQLIEESKDDITKIMTIECGKPLAESRNEFDGGLESIRWFAEEAKRSSGDVLESPSRDRRFIVLRQPIGVVAAITPWNFPFSMITRKTSPALAAGCPVILKPSEMTPLTALALGELARRAGMPAGVFNVMPTRNAKAVGDAFMESRLVRKFGFTGSTAVGKSLAAAAAKTVKRVSLELGGNAPFIVFKDADLEKAARDVVLSSYRNAGQTCICTNRVLVESSVHDAFVDLLVKRAAALKLGDGLQSGTTHGPLISASAIDRVDQKVSEALAAGATASLGGRKATFRGDSPLAGGFFYEPTVLTHVQPDMRIFSEEIFGPVTPVVQFEMEEQAVQAANNTPYGLAAYFYTRDLGRAWRVSEALEYGMVGVNSVAITSEVAPFGGVKESGYGREQSKYGLIEFQNMKTVCLGISS